MIFKKGEFMEKINYLECKYYAKNYDKYRGE